MFTKENKKSFRSKGVYKIVNILTNDQYIGSTDVDFGSRFRSHICYLKRNEHFNKILQRVFNKYGEKTLEFKIIEILNDENLDLIRDREQFYIDNVNSTYNMVKDVKSLFTKKSILGNNQIIEIYDLYALGKHTNREIALIFKVSEPVISSTLRNSEKYLDIIKPNIIEKVNLISLKNIKKGLDFGRKAKRKFSIDKVAAIRYLSSKGYSQSLIADIFKMKKYQIKSIKSSRNNLYTEVKPELSFEINKMVSKYIFKYNILDTNTCVTADIKVVDLNDNILDFKSVGSLEHYIKETYDLEVFNFDQLKKKTLINEYYKGFKFISKHIINNN